MVKEFEWSFPIKIDQLTPNNQSLKYAVSLDKEDCEVLLNPFSNDASLVTVKSEMMGIILLATPNILLRDFYNCYEKKYGKKCMCCGAFVKTQKDVWVCRDIASKNGNNYLLILCIACIGTANVFNQRNKMLKTRTIIGFSDVPQGVLNLAMRKNYEAAKKMFWDFDIRINEINSEGIVRFEAFSEKSRLSFARYRGYSDSMVQNGGSLRIEIHKTQGGTIELTEFDNRYLRIKYDKEVFRADER